MPKSEFESELFVTGGRVQVFGPFTADARLAAAGEVEVIVWRVQQGDQIAHGQLTVQAAAEAGRRERGEGIWWDIEPMDEALDASEAFTSRWRDGAATASSVVVGLGAVGASLFSWSQPVTLRNL